MWYPVKGPERRRQTPSIAPFCLICLPSAFYAFPLASFISIDSSTDFSQLLPPLYAPSPPYMPLPLILFYICPHLYLPFTGYMLKTHIFHLRRPPHNLASTDILAAATTAATTITDKWNAGQLYGKLCSFPRPLRLPQHLFPPAGYRKRTKNDNHKYCMCSKRFLLSQRGRKGGDGRGRENAGWLRC